jgi:hypothetical protein
MSKENRKFGIGLCANLHSAISHNLHRKKPSEYGMMLTMCSQLATQEFYSSIVHKEQLLLA